jgi:hypothetical protein
VKSIKERDYNLQITVQQLQQVLYDGSSTVLVREDRPNTVYVESLRPVSTTERVFMFMFMFMGV